MSHHRAVGDSLLASIRAYFGLLQWELAGLLRVSEPYYRLLEAGKRRSRNEWTPMLVALAQPTMPEEATRAEPLPPPPPDVPLDRAALDARLDYCQQHAARLRREQLPYARRARFEARWRAALPALRADPAFADERAQRWLDYYPPTQPRADLTAWHLLEARAAGLEAEAAALRALGAQAPTTS